MVKQITEVFDLKGNLISKNERLITEAKMVSLIFQAGYLNSDPDEKISVYGVTIRRHFEDRIADNTFITDSMEEELNS